MPDPMDPESSDSDVSVGGGDEYRFASPLTAPNPLPAPASKHALESSDAIQARLDDLQRLEEHNIKKYELLKAKRVRKDDKIRRRREIQDKKISAVMDARQRRDARVEARRKREDGVFAQFFDHELEEEENSLRRRLKRLKRGLPPEESPKLELGSIPATSMSPPGPALSTIPPPSKRHQVGPPGQPDAVNSAPSRPTQQTSLAAPPKSSLPAPSYSMYRDSGLFTRPYNQPSTYAAAPTNASPPVHANGLSHHSSQPPPSSVDRSPFGRMPRPASPLSRVGGPPSSQSPATPVTTTGNPSRVVSSSYDTRPPPTTASSGFASINPPPASGFATINARSTATPPAAHPNLSRPGLDVEANKTPVHAVSSNGMDNRFHSYSNTPNSAPAATTSSASKRTPSTTHPYQMSEAFANRHHHCERVDGLNRGIWTSYGVGGTQDHPTGPAVEMYLRCNHDGCTRIDWRTVHGLQCHIVKNHDQPKGTIGSLDKALEKYGVPVKEVEDYEGEHGRGSAGTMADPKNHKIRLKTKEAAGTRMYVRKSPSGSYSMDPQATPAGYRPSSNGADDSSPGSDGLKKNSPGIEMINGGASMLGNPISAPDGARKWTSQPPTAPSGGAFQPVRADWTSSPATNWRPEPEPKQLQGDFGASEASSREQLPSTQAHGVNGATARSVSANMTAPLQKSPGPPSTNGPLGAAQDQAAPPATAQGATPAPANDSALAARAELKSEEAPPVETRAGGQDATSQPEKPSLQEARDGDVAMTGVSETEDKKANGQTNGHVTGEPKVEPEMQEQSDDSQEDHSETIVIDGDAGKDASVAKRSVAQSPRLTTKTLPTNTPDSARRMSRRASIVRKSADMDGETATGHGRDSKHHGDIEEKEEKGGKEEKEEREPVRYEPRRSMTGRMLRRGRT